MRCLLAFLVLFGCAWTPIGYICPYQDTSTAFYLAPIEVGYFEISKYCGNRVAGCLVRDTWQMYLVDELSEEGRARVVSHEVCHAHEVQVLGISPAESAAHKGWLR